MNFLTMIDTLIHARWVFPVNDQFEQLENHSIAIEHGRIIQVLPTDMAKQRYQARHEVIRDEHAVIPGLINVHTHIAMTLLRGLADDLPLADWLNNHIWPAEAKHVNPDFVQLGTRLGVAEMLRSGTTCFNDMYFFPNDVAQVAAETGIRAVVGMIVIDFPSAWAENSDTYFQKGLSLADQYRDHPLISTVFAPHAPYTVNDENLKRIASMANEMVAKDHYKEY